MIMKMHYFLALFIGSIAAQAQMYVSPSSYVYVNDQVLFVKQDVNLNVASSNIYLRKDGQLIQGTTTAGNNKGQGALSVYQEGSVNNFLYNYWCSPVGIPVSASTINDSFGVAQLGVPSINLDTRSFASASMLATTVYDGVSSSGALSIAPYWIWKYIQRSAYDLSGPNGWIHVLSSPTINPGEGFTMKGSTGSDAIIPFTGATANNTAGTSQRYDFRGKPNDGTISVPVSTAKLSLIGNPYPSAIDLNLFLADAGNAALIDGTAYFWQQSNIASHNIGAYQGGYAKYTVALGFLAADIRSFNPDGTYIPGSLGTGVSKLVRFTPIGQGFMVKGTAAGSVSMKNTFRTYVKEGNANNSDFVRMASNSNTHNTNSVYDPNSEYYPEILNVAGIDYTQVKKAYAPQIRINTTIDNTSIVHNALGFKDTCTNGFDYSADAKSTNSSAPSNVYFILNSQDGEFAMSADRFDVDKKHPIGLRNTNQTNFKIKVSELLWNFDANQAIYLHDKLVDTYTDIKNNEFVITLPPGNIKDRFEITFKNTVALSTNDSVLAENLIVFQNNKNSMLTLKNPTGIALKSFELFDISGKAMLSKSKLGTELIYEYSTVALSEGVYVAKLITETNQVIATKVVVSNLK